MRGKRENFFSREKSRTATSVFFPRIVQPKPLAKAEPISPFQEKQKTFLNKFYLPVRETEPKEKVSSS